MFNQFSIGRLVAKDLNDEPLYFEIVGVDGKHLTLQKLALKRTRLPSGGWELEAIRGSKVGEPVTGRVLRAHRVSVKLPGHYHVTRMDPCYSPKTWRVGTGSSDHPA